MAETVYAIINNNTVANTIVASAIFVSRYFPAAIRIDTLSPQPGVGWRYADSTFSHTVTEELVFNGTALTLPAGAALNALKSADGETTYSAASDYTVSGATVAQVASGTLTSDQKVLITYTLTALVGA